MKSLAQKPARSAAKVQRKPSAPGRQRDGHEVQADQAARAFVRGETGLGSRLTPTPAAGFVLPGSRGESLPLSMRTTLEAAYDAHLGAVRIHRDAAAEGAASKFGAHAFASGSHIFFGAGRFDLASECGRELIAHEVAHVLQQTGRKGSDHRLWVTAQAGVADIQCKTLDELSKSKGDKILNRIADKHMAASADKTLERAVEDVKTITKGPSGSFLPINLPATNLAGDLIAGLVATHKTIPAQGFLLDCLKVLGDPYNVDSEELLDNDKGHETRVSFASGNLIGALFADMGDDWIADAFAQKDLKKFLGMFRAMIREFFFGPWRETRPVDGLKPMIADIRVKGTLASADLTVNDRVRAAFDFLEKLDDTRVELFNGWKADIEKDINAVRTKENLGPVAPVFSRKILISVVARNWADAGQSLEINEEEKAKKKQTLSAIELFWRDAKFLPGAFRNDENKQAFAERLRLVMIFKNRTTGGDLFATLADEAIAFWDGAEADFKSRMAMIDTGSLEELVSNAAKLRQSDIKNDGDVAVLGMTLAALAKELFKLQANKKSAAAVGGTPPSVADLIPPPDEYQKRLQAFENALNRQTSQVMPGGVRLLQAFGLRAATSKDAANAGALGWVMVMTSRLIDALHHYTAALEAAPNATSDVRVAHRARMAWNLLSIGLLIGNKPLVDVAADVLRAKEIGHSYLALVSDWETDTEAPIEQMVVDNAIDKDNPARMSGPKAPLRLSLQSIVRIFQADSLEKLAARLEIAVAPGRQKTGVLTKEDLPDLKKAEEDWQVDIKVKRPERWLVKDAKFVFFPHQGQDPVFAKANPMKTKPSPYVIAELIRDHDKTKSQLLPKQDPNGLTIFSTSGNVVVWLVPDLSPQIKRLRQRDALKSYGADIADDYEWLDKLASLVTPTGKSAENLLKNEVDKRLDEGASAVDLKLRDATSLNRRKARQDFVEALAEVIKGIQATTLAKVYRSEDVALDFSRSIQPKADIQVQQAVFILSVAAEMKAAFAPDTDADNHASGGGDSSRAQYIHPLYFPFLEQGIDFAQNQQALLLQVAPLDRLQQRNKALRDVEWAYKRERDKLQSRFGFQSEDGKTIRAVEWYPEFLAGKGDVFAWNSSDDPIQFEYEVARVYQPFVYHQQHGIGQSEPMLQTAENGMPINDGSPLFTMRRRAVPGKAPTAPSFKPQSEEEFNKGAAEEITLYAFKEGESHDERYTKILQLNSYSDMFEGVGLKRQMENLAAGVQQGYELSLDVVELVPGVGQSVTAARAAVAVTQFLATDEFQSLLDRVRRDPLNFVEEIAENVGQEVLDPANLWTFVLLGEMPAPIQGLLNLQSKKAGTKGKSIGEEQVKEESSGRLAKVFRLIKRLAARFFAALKHLKAKFRGPVRSLQAGIVSRPRLAFALRWSIDNAEIAVEKVQEYRSIFTRANEFKQDFSERVHGLLKTLEELELPDKVMPIAWVIESVMSFALRKILKGIKGKAVGHVLNTLGITRAVSGEIGKALEDAGDDPNVLWVEKIKPLVEDRFQKVRNWLVDAFKSTLDLLKDFGLDLGAPARASGSLAVQTVDDTREESDLKPSASLAPSGEPPPTVRSAGSPLESSVRADVERRFGHNFRHVRLHTGSDAAGLTSAYGADGMTTGSHVYLRPGLSPSTGSGSQVLDHELAHVIQQTGPRPLGIPHDDSPSRGKPAVGVHYEAARESSADRAAAQARSGSEGPIMVEGGGARGLQPSIESVARDVLKKLTTADTASAFEAGVPVGEGVPKFKEKVKDPIWDALLARIDKKEAGDYGAPAKHDIPTVAKHLKGILDTAAGDVDKVAALAIHDKPGGEVKENPDGTKTREKEVDLPRFASLLRGFVEVITGVSIDVNLEADGKFKSVKIDAIDLGRIDPNSDLWKAVQKNSGGIVGTILTDAEKHEIHERLKAIPDPVAIEIVSGKLPKLVSVWDSGKFSLHPNYLAHLKNLRSLRGAPSALPSRDAYLATRAKDGVGLRISTHGDLTSAGRDKAGQKRESHHTTQFLLIDYFSNTRSKQRPFPERDGTGTYDYSSLNQNGDMSGGGSAKVEKVGNIDVGILNTSPRGGAMPAILIAKETHTRGNLHLQRESDWNGDPDSGEEIEGRKSSQGPLMHEYFRAALPKELQNAPEFNKEAKESPSNTIKKIEDAVNKTYGMMYGRMRTALKDALPGLELAYYHAMVINSGLGKIDDNRRIKPEQMRKVANDAHDNNVSIMKNAGWKTTVS
jgi:tetratricopeptide (TPR) repeat protein